MANVVSALFPIGISFAFLVANVLCLLAVLALNRRAGPSTTAKAAPEPPREVIGQHLEPSDILGWEFEYARVTASEAMNERHTMVNFYLLAAGVVASGVAVTLDRDTRLPTAVGTALFWLLCSIGWLYFLGIIRLRQAWHDSTQAMNQIKSFYIQHAGRSDEYKLSEAFRWQAHTLPPPDKPWTIYFYSAMLIGLLDSAAYVGGGALLHYGATGTFATVILIPLTAFGLTLFAFHVWLYFAFLKEDDRGRRGSDRNRER